MVLMTGRYRYNWLTGIDVLLARLALMMQWWRGWYGYYSAGWLTWLLLTVERELQLMTKLTLLIAFFNINWWLISPGLIAEVNGSSKLAMACCNVKLFALTDDTVVIVDGDRYLLDLLLLAVSWPLPYCAIIEDYYYYYYWHAMIL